MRLDPRDIQRVLAAGSFYTGGIDGDFGPASWRAVAAAERDLRARYANDPARWSRKRRMIGAAQAVLGALNYAPGRADGYAGHNTREALRAFDYRILHGAVEAVPRVALVDYSDRTHLPRQSELWSFYGTPGAGGMVEHRLKTLDLPFAMRIDWNPRQRTRRVRAHEKCVHSLRAALVAVHDHYGERWKPLGLDRMAGTYNPRRMRGGSAWSTHAYGCAIDIHATPNGLRMRCPEALFCQPEYTDFLDIMEAHDWLPALRLWGSDAMHFQQARL